jgi:hypothetical protein
LSSVPGCPIITYKTSNQNTIVNLPGSGFVQDPTETSAGSGMFEVRPQDDTVDARYDFYVEVAAEGGNLIYSQ